MYNYRPDNKRYNREKKGNYNGYEDVCIDPYGTVMCPCCGSTDVIPEMHYCNSCGNTWD